MPKKTKIIICLILMVLGINTAVFAENFSSNIAIDFENWIVTYSGVSGTKPSKIVNAIVVSGETVSDESNVIGMDSVFTAEDGLYSGSVYLNPNTAPGVYKVFVDSENGSESKRFIVIDEASSASYLSTLNQKTTNEEFKTYLKNNSEKFGFFSEDFSESFSFAADVIYAKKPQNGYASSKEVNNAFEKAVLIYEVITNPDIDKALSNNKEALGIDYEEYKNLTAESKAFLNELLKNSDYKKDTFEKIYEKNLIYAEIKTADRWTVQKERILKYSDRMGYTFPQKYNLVYNKDSVFQNVFKETGSITSFETIISKLDAAIDKVYLEETNFNASVGTGSSGGGSRGGGFGGASTTVPNENPPSETKTLNDIKDHWAESYINNLVKKGGISGYEDGSFKPDNTITRAEFTKIIVGVFEISGDTETKYSDVSDDTWYSEYVKKASASGIINGSDGMFLPNNNITRQDAALIIYRVLKLKNIEMNSGKSFSDDSEISEYAKDAVSKMAVIGVINGYDGKFMPKNNITRAEAVTMIARALDLA